MKRKVLIVLPELETGGGQRMALSIAHGIDPENVQIRILVLYPRCGNILEKVADEWGLDVQYLQKKSGADLGCIVQIYRAILQFQPDVIHAHLRVMPYLLLPMCLSKSRLRYYTVHNLADRDASGIKQHILRFAFRHCQVQPVAISDLCRRSITEVYGIPENIIPCIYVGIDTKHFARRGECAYNETLQFVAVGRLDRQKNYTLMLRAFADIHYRFPNANLVILGDGNLRNLLEKQCIDLKINQSVIFAGIVSNVEDYLWASQIYLMSSDYEGLPQTVLEAMAAGLPIISTKAGGVIDVVEDGQNGLLVDCGDQAALSKAMEKLLLSPELCKQFSERSVMLAQKYSIESCAAQYKELYLA